MATTPAPPQAPPKPTWDPPSAAPFPWLRPTIRIRLTLLYGGMFLIAGILLLSIIYLLAAQALNPGSDLPFKITSGSVTSDTCNLPTKATPEVFNTAMNDCVNEQRQHALDSLLSRSLLALLGLAVIAFAFGYAMAGRVLSPLGRITRTARAVAGSDLSRRIELDGPDDELKELADTFDDMLERLQRAFTAQQRFVGNASHELRTPLAINRTLLEVHLSDPGAPVELQQLTEVTGVAAIELKLIAELHEVYGVRPPGNLAQRSTAYLGSWSDERGIDMTKPSTFGAAMNGPMKRQLRQQIMKRMVRNLPNLMPFMVGAAVGAVMNRRDTAKLAARIREDLRKVQVPWDALPELPPLEPPKDALELGDGEH
ncbi:hypothetical protein SFUMM280S_10018 [Streptomyces fumanus]